MQIFFLLLVIIISTLSSKYSLFWNLSIENIKFSFQYNNIIKILFTLISLLAFLSIIFFKKRIWQIKINKINILINLIIIIIIFYHIFHSYKNYYFTDNCINILLSIFSIYFLNISNKIIRKNHNLIKSIDRIC